jgi:hypothetical protein
VTPGGELTEEPPADVPGGPGNSDPHQVTRRLQ